MIGLQVVGQGIIWAGDWVSVTVLKSIQPAKRDGETLPAVVRLSRCFCTLFTKSLGAC